MAGLPRLRLQAASFGSTAATMSMAAKRLPARLPTWRSAYRVRWWSSSACYRPKIAQGSCAIFPDWPAASSPFRFTRTRPCRPASSPKLRLASAFRHLLVTIWKAPSILPVSSNSSRRRASSLPGHCILPGRCWRRTARRPNNCSRQPRAPSDPDFAEIDAGPQIDLENFRAAGGEDLNGIASRILIQPIEFKVAEIVRGGHRERGAVFDKLHACAFDAVDDALPLLGDRAADEAFRI